MMQYQKYKAVKSLWNLNFPAHWDVFPLCSMAKEKSICNCTDLELLSVYLDAGVVPFSKRIEKRTNTTSKDLSKYQRVDVGDFVLNNQQAWRGSVGVSKYTGITSPAYIILSLNDQLTIDYANYLFRSRIMVDQYLVASKGVGSIQRNLYWQELKRASVLVPPKDEQEQIVRYLNWKVSYINRLIHGYQRQIKLLEEIKNTIVDNAVFHGIRNNNLVFSGNKLLEDIPEHWKIVKLRTLLAPISIKNHPTEQLLSVVRELGIIVRDVENKESNHNYIPEDLSGYKFVEQGNFVINKMKAWQGSYGVSNYRGIVSPAYYVFELKYECPEFFHIAIRSKRYVQFFNQASDGIRVGQWDLSVNRMKEIPFVVPPVEEQMEIVDYIKVKFSEIESAKPMLEKGMDFLREYRTRLISDVVTGQVDVRDVEIPDYTFEDDNTLNEETDDIEEVSDDAE